MYTKKNIVKKKQGKLQFKAVTEIQTGKINQLGKKSKRIQCKMV